MLTTIGKTIRRHIQNAHNLRCVHRQARKVSTRCCQIFDGGNSLVTVIRFSQHRINMHATRRIAIVIASLHNINMTELPPASRQC